MNTQQFTELIQNLDKSLSSVEKLRMINILEKAWIKWLQEQYAFDMNSDVALHIYGKAYADGHASGYFEIETLYQEVAEFARVILTAA